jgi:UDPglucose--hexose-1-phosphate uridylyltransferase
MSEFRQDIVTKEWVLIAPSRTSRPNEFHTEEATPQDLPEVFPSCVFCPGQEEKTPPEIASYPASRMWRVRVVPNKFGLLQLEETMPKRDFYVRLPGVGSHEVVITRPHNQPLAHLPVEDIEMMLSVYVDRIEELKRHESVKYVHIIQNHGKLGGASLVHPHSQIFAMPFLGPHIQQELRGASAHFDIFDQCIYCEVLRHERSVRKRIVEETERFVVTCPFESKMPYQMRIIPKRHQANFHEITKDERAELAAILKRCLGALYDKLGNPSYNYYLHTMPFQRSRNINHNEESYHWHIVILPRVNIWAGLELGTEIYVNVIPPEEAAEFLRAKPA